MRPPITSVNLTDSSARDSILCSDNAVNNTFNQFNFNCFDFLYGEFLRCRTTLSALFNHIYHIINSSTQKQMGRITTYRIIAFMQNPKDLWNRSMSQYPSKPVSTDVLSFMLKCTITPACATNPIPALLRTKFFDLNPEATFSRTKRVITFTCFKRMLTEFTSFKHKTLIPEAL